MNPILLSNSELEIIAHAIMREIDSCNPTDSKTKAELTKLLNKLNKERKVSK